MERKKYLVIALFAVLFIVTFFRIPTASANVPSVDAPVVWKNEIGHTVVNITIHHDYSALNISSHYIDQIELDVDGVQNFINLSNSPRQPNLVFTIQHDMGAISGTPTLKARAHCTIHSWSAFSSSTQIPGFSSFLLSDVNLLFQVVILVLLVGGFVGAKFRRSFMKHGAIMAIALVMNTISILVVMVPSLLAIESVFEDLSTRLALVIGSHMILGSLVEVLGIYLVGTWAFSHHNIKQCAGRKRIMRVTIGLWLIEIFLGIYIYALLYLHI